MWKYWMGKVNGRDIPLKNKKNILRLEEKD